MGFVVFAAFFLRRNGHIARCGGGEIDILGHALLLQEVVAAAGLARIKPDAAGNEGSHFFLKKLAGEAGLKLSGALALLAENIGVQRGIELSLVVAEGGDIFHVLPEFQGRDGETVFAGFLHEEFLGEEALENLMPELGFVLIGPASAGVRLVGLLLGPAVRHLEGLEGDGLAVDHGHDVDGTGIRDAADAPEDKDQDDDAEGEFDAERLRVGTDEVEHVFSAFRNA